MDIVEWISEGVRISMFTVIIHRFCFGLLSTSLCDLGLDH